MQIIMWKEIILLIVGGCTLSGIIGGALFYLLRTKFMTRSDCTLNQDRCHAKFCQKLDKIENMLHQRQIVREAEHNANYKRNIWMAKAFTLIADKLGIEITDMPT